MALPLILAIFFVSLDRFAKVYALANLKFNHISLWADILRLNLAQNTGIAFSLPFSGPILVVFLVVLIIFLLIYCLKLANKGEFNGAGCLLIVLGGAMSNLYDRLYYGFVVDYIDLKWFTVFNIADIMIVLGFLCLLIVEVKRTNHIAD